MLKGGRLNMNYSWLDEYLLSKQGALKDYKEEWQWDRYQVGQKLFAAICKNDLGNPIITLKLPPMEGAMLREQYEEIKPGYYMNKVHWNSINLLGDVEDEILKNLIDQSYELVFNKLSKKLQETIRGGGVA
jgi:predicted DNA-binding protein (MmcQ/YjbR family)